MADQKRFNGTVGFNGQVDFTQDVQIKIAATSTEGPEQTFHGKNITDKIDPYQQGTTKLFPLGSKLKYGDREFVYAFMGGACTAGKLVAHKEHGKANHTNMAPTANTAAGSYTVSIETAGDTDLTANEYADGYLMVIAGTGAGQRWKIKSHPAHDHSDDESCVITLYDPVTTTLATSDSKLTLVPSNYLDVVVAPHAELGTVVGATVIDMSDDNYGWLQVKGPAAMLSRGTLVLGHGVSRATAAVAGAVQPIAADTDACVGTVIFAESDTEYSLVQLDIQ
mgnify:CR=1 FL=1|tara:strand:- start:4535 stop:5374 length:840 start_codon:yes stop_codon:yes gene_type:complete